jgi:hypothetical protein
MQHVTEVLKIYPPANDNEHVRLYITQPTIYSTKDANLVSVPTANLISFQKLASLTLELNCIIL